MKLVTMRLLSWADSTTLTPLSLYNLTTVHLQDGSFLGASATSRKSGKNNDPDIETCFGVLIEPCKTHNSTNSTVS